MSQIAGDKPVYVVSGGAGASGELLLQTLLAQFPAARVQVVVFPHVHMSKQVAEIVTRAAEENATILHTLVDGDLRQQLCSTALSCNVPDVDLVGNLMEHLAQLTGDVPLGKPGRYREFHNGYFKRIEAIEFTVKHDDGQKLDEFTDADIVLLGVSRVGKTPLSIYLSLEGWKTANYPLIPLTPLPVELERVKPSRVVGLTIAPAQLVRFRLLRQKSLGVSGGDYVELQHVIEEVRAANHMFGQHGFHTVDVTDKNVEAISEEVVAAMTGDHR